MWPFLFVSKAPAPDASSADATDSVDACTCANAQLHSCQRPPLVRTTEAIAQL